MVFCLFDKMAMFECVNGHMPLCICRPVVLKSEMAGSKCRNGQMAGCKCIDELRHPHLYICLSECVNA